MNHLRRTRAALIALAGALLALATAPAAFAKPLPPPDCCTTVQPPAPVLAEGGMPGWQITLIAVGAALAAAGLAVLVNRARAARKAHAAA